jgi:hypothetical protein
MTMGPNLSRFDTQEIELLVSLPYRIGCMISDADDEEGGHDDEQEEEALREIIRTLADGEKGTAFTSEVATETLKRSESWPQWQTKIFDVDDDCRRSIALIESKLGKVKAKNFRMAMLVIARSVAKAADEFDDFNPDEEEHGGIGAFARKLKAKINPKADREESHVANISAAEQAEINLLMAALHVDE